MEKEVQHIGRIVEKVLKSHRRKADSDLTCIWDVWEGIVGEVVASHTRPEAFKGRLLLVTVSNSTWIHHLQFLKKDIVQKINDHFSKNVVDEIRFKIGVL